MNSVNNVVNEDKVTAGRALFAKYDEADKEVERAKAEYEKTLVARSVIVKSIHDALGKGPFLFQGSAVKIVARGDTYFFRGKSKETVLDMG